MTRAFQAFGLAAAVLAAQGCSLVGYPAGSAAPAPGTMETQIRTAGGGGARVAGPTRVPEGARPSDGGRTYEVFGEEYRVLSSADGYEETGMASWYGEQFHGRPTASGEEFDMYGYTAAHRTLPLHTWVEVTNLANQRALIIRVNDRGPFAHTDTRILDLSYGAARELDVIGAGVARVRVRALSADEVAGLR